MLVATMYRRDLDFFFKDWLLEENPGDRRICIVSRVGISLVRVQRPHYDPSFESRRDSESMAEAAMQDFIQVFPQPVALDFKNSALFSQHTHRCNMPSGREAVELH